MIKKFLKSVMVIALAGSMVGGATVAAWTASATSAGNTVDTTTLTVQVKRDNGDAYPGPLFYTDDSQGGPPQWGAVNGENATRLWYPGKSVSRVMWVKNTNTENINVKVTGIKFNLSGLTPGTPAYNEFVSKMSFQIKYGSTELANKPLSDFLNGVNINPALSPATVPGSETGFEIIATLASTANNDVQSISPVIEFVVTVTQS